MNAPFHFEGLPQEQLRAPTATPWAWWQASLAGQPQAFDDTAPQTGFYRYKRKAVDRGSPCAIWHDGEAWICLIDGEAFQAVSHAWRFAYKQPISQERYEVVLAGGPWPDEIATANAMVEPEPDAPAGMGHNTATPEELALDEIRQADIAFAAWLDSQGGVITDEEQDQVVKGYDDRIAKLRKDAEAARKEEKDAYLRAGLAIDAKWAPVKAAALEAEKKISEAATPYRVERKRRTDEALRLEREAREAQKKQAAAEGAPVPMMQPRSPARATGLRKVETAIVEDPKALALYLIEIGNTEIVDLLQKLATRILKAGAAAPGARLDVSFKA